MKRILFIIAFNILLGPTFGCNKAGQFLNEDVANCQGGVVCIVISTDIFSEINYNCTEHFTFDPFQRQCSNSTDFLCTYKPIEFECNETNTFEYANNKDCVSFIGCYLSRFNNYKSMLFDCKDGYVYSPIDKKCVPNSEYLCPRIPIVESTTNLGSAFVDKPNSGYLFRVNIVGNVILLLGVFFN